jgi:hypothetical protein
VKKKILLLISAGMLVLSICAVMYSCESREFLGYNSIIENISDIIYENRNCENREMSENMPDYSVNFSVLNETGENMPEKSIISVGDSKKLKFTAQIEYFSNMPNIMGIYVFVDGVPVRFLSDKEKTSSFYHEFKAVQGEVSKISISLDGSILGEKNIITVVLMTEQNIMPLYDQDINYAYSVPFNFYTEKYGGNYIKNEPTSNIYSTKNISDDILKYNAENKPDKKDVMVLSDVADKAINTPYILIGKENKINSIYDNKVFITNKIGEENNYVLQAFGKKGKYITTLFINNEPYNGFYGSFSAEWEITSEENYISIPVSLPTDKKSYDGAVIYTLTFRTDDPDDLKAYESPKQRLELVGYTPKDEFTGSVDYDRPVAFGVKDSNDDIMINGSEYQYGGKTIKYSIFQNLPEDRFTPGKTLFITVDGMVQEIKVNGKKTKFYNYELLRNLPIELKIMFDPKFVLNPDKFIVNIYIVDNFNNFIAEKPQIRKFSSSYKFIYVCKDNNRFTSAKDLCYINPNLYSINEEAHIYGQSYIKVYETEKPEFALSSRGTFKIDTNKNIRLTFEAYNLTANKYVTFFTLNGEIIPLIDNKKYMMWEMEDILQLVTFEVEIDKKYIENFNSINIVTTELNYSMSPSSLLWENIYYLSLTARQKSEITDTVSIDYTNATFSININDKAQENIYVNGCNTAFTAKNIKNNVFTNVLFSVNKENLGDIELKDASKYGTYYLAVGVFKQKETELIFNKYYLYYLDGINVTNITFVDDTHKHSD